MFTRALEHPDDIAIVEPSGTWTWAEAGEAVARTANALMNVHLGVGGRVAVIGENAASTLIVSAAAIVGGYRHHPREPVPHPGGDRAHARRWQRRNALGG